MSAEVRGGSGQRRPDQIFAAPNRSEDYILVENGSAREHRYVRQPFENEPDFHVYSVDYGLQELLGRSDSPS